MAAPNMNGSLHLTDVHQNSPASLFYLNVTNIKIEAQRQCSNDRIQV